MPSLPVPLTQFSEEEQMFCESVREFAQAKIRPHVRSMDEAGKFEPNLLRQFLTCTLGIEIPRITAAQVAGSSCRYWPSRSSPV
jgi:hypothetical protein